MGLIMRIVVLFFALAGAATTATAASLPLGGGYGAIDAPRDVTPQSLGERFCSARVDGRSMAEFEQWFSPKLTAVLDDHVDDAPWQSVADRPASCTISVVNGYDDTINVLVRVTYTTPSATWSDTLNLQRTPTTWLLDNVFYEGGGNLRFRLFETGS